jgi:cytochrome c peroxidase
MGGPKVPWRAGRIDGFEKDATPDGRLPDASQAQDHLRAVSLSAYIRRVICSNRRYTRSSTAWDSMTRRLLRSRVHTLWDDAIGTGGCNLNVKCTLLSWMISSGFDGPWTFSPTSLTNEYFKLLLNEKWQWRKWDGPKQLEDKTTKSLMMLP